MGQSLSKVYVHIIFSTKHRKDFIDEYIESQLFEYIGGICKSSGCNPIKVGGYKNHVHILCQLSKIITQTKLLKDIKRQSSKWIKTKGERYKHFYWQNGYGIFSVNPSKLNVVSTYIENQKKHHSKESFKEELTAYFNRYKITFDEEYVWD